MIEVYQGEQAVSLIIKNSFDVQSVKGYHTLYNTDGMPVEEDYVLTYAETPIGATPVSKEVTVDVLTLSSWPTNFRIEIECLDGVATKFVKSYYDVVTPYTTPDAIAASGNIDMYDSDATNYHSYSSVRDAEAAARFVIESQTGRSFGRHYNQQVVDGTDLDCLYVDEHITWIGLVMHDEEPIYSDTTGSYTVSPSGHVIKIKDDSGQYYGFPEGFKYTIIGIFGEDSVSADVEMATRLLAVHYLCSDSTTQNNYIESVKFGESATKANRLAFHGTGVMVVDKIIEKYKFHNYRVL